MVAVLADPQGYDPEAPCIRRGSRPPARGSGGPASAEAAPRPALRAIGTAPVKAAPRPALSPEVYRRRRMAVAGLVAAILVLGWIGLQAAGGRIGSGPLAATGAPGGLRAAGAAVWVVRPGDTLWSIALAIHPGSDARPLVDRLAAELGGTVLYPGESIPLPPATART